MIRQTTVTAVLVLAVCSPCQAQIFGGRDDYTAPRNATVSTTGMKQLYVEAEAGYLNIKGVAGISEVRVKGTARASRKDLLDEIKLTTERRGSEVVVIVDIPDHDWRNWRDDHQQLDLDIEIPKGFDAEVKDGSGELEISGTGALDLHDGSGTIRLDDIGGKLEIEDGSGGIRVRTVRGDVWVRDGSGEIDIANVTGSVLVDSDGSGDIDVRDVSGSFRVREDGSGSITATTVGGDFVVDRDGSGGINYSGVKGRVDVPDDRRHRRRDRDRDRDRDRWQ